MEVICWVVGEIRTSPSLMTTLAVVIFATGYIIGYIRKSDIVKPPEKNY
jgi:hypothetical protein